MPSPRPEAVLAQVAAALEQSDLAGAWTHMEALTAERDSDPEIAAMWLGLLRSSPDRPTLQAEVRAILDRFPSDATLVTRGCDALIRVAERKAPDEPQAADGPAALAASAAERCLEALREDDFDPLIAGYLHIAAGNAKRIQRDYDSALKHIKVALELAPDRGGFWFNLGLLHKARLAFPAALTANERAAALLGEEKPVLWNLAICATGAGRADVALRALRALGHDAKIASTGMPVVEGLPPVQVRAATLGSGHARADGAQAMTDRSVGFELLWVTPLSPVHGVVSSATYREASVDYGDVVLWDAVPIGVTEIEGRPVPRFPLLAILHKGKEHRFRFVALQQNAGDVEALGSKLPETCKLFIHAERIEQLCARCASGESMHKHTHTAKEDHRLVYGKIVVEAGADLKSVQRDLDALMKSSPTVQLVMPGILEALGETAAAGKAHQLWRGLEKLH